MSLSFHPASNSLVCPFPLKTLFGVSRLAWAAEERKLYAEVCERRGNLPTHHSARPSEASLIRALGSALPAFGGKPCPLRLVSVRWQVSPAVKSAENTVEEQKF